MADDTYNAIESLVHAQRWVRIPIGKIGHP